MTILKPREIACIINEIKKEKTIYSKSKTLSEEEKKLIVNTWKVYPLNAVLMQRYLMIKFKKKISKNQIYKIQKEAGNIKNEPKKQKRRKWVRYERYHSNSLCHVDWSEMDDGKQLIIYEDDASRFIIGYGVFDEATLENALKVFLKAVSKYGVPKQLLSDNGSQFRFNERFDAPLGIENRFQKTLKNLGVEQIFTRPHHPQCNGKLEKLNDTIKKLTKHFGTIEKAIDYYNFRRPHMSLNLDILETPHMAFLRKKRKGR